MSIVGKRDLSIDPSAALSVAACEGINVLFKQQALGIPPHR